MLCKVNLRGIYVLMPISSINIVRFREQPMETDIEILPIHFGLLMGGRGMRRNQRTSRDSAELVGAVALDA